VPESERLAAGVTENLIRLSIGLEALEDLRVDLARGLDLLV
jgi:O-succinylhomoserine sulfhydrylase